MRALFDEQIIFCLTIQHEIFPIRKSPLRLRVVCNLWRTFSAEIEVKAGKHEWMGAHRVCGNAILMEDEHSLRRQVKL